MLHNTTPHQQLLSCLRSCDASRVTLSDWNHEDGEGGACTRYAVTVDRNTIAEWSVDHVGVTEAGEIYLWVKQALESGVNNESGENNESQHRNPHESLLQRVRLQVRARRVSSGGRYSRRRV